MADVTSRSIDSSEMELRLGGTSFRVNSGVLQRSVDSGVTWTAVEQAAQNTKNEFGPEDHGALGWTDAPYIFASGQVPAVKSQLNGVRVYVKKAGTVTAIGLNVLTLGATLTAGQNKAAFFNVAGTLLGTSVDQSSAWSSGNAGYRACNLAATVVVPIGFYDIVWWGNGTTLPAFARASNASANNFGLTGQDYRFFTTAGTAVTTDPPATLDTKSPSNTAYWAALVGS